MSNLLDKIEMVVVLILAALFWLYIGAGVLALIASALGWTAVVSALAGFLNTAIIYIFVASFFLLFWPVEDEGPYLS